MGMIFDILYHEAVVKNDIPKLPLLRKAKIKTAIKIFAIQHRSVVYKMIDNRIL